MSERDGTVGSLAHYLIPTQFGADQGILVAMRLLAAAPPNPSPAVEAALATVRREAENVRSILKGRLGDAPRLRHLHLALSSAWVGIRGRLESLMRCGTEQHQQRAVDLLQRVLPHGTSFVTGRSSQVWNTSQSLLERIDDDGWQSEVDELVGPGILEHTRELHAELGQALGVGPDRYDRSDPKAVRRQLRVLARAIANYGRILVGEVDLDDRDSLDRLYRALAPVDQFRAESFRRRSEPGGDEITGGELDDAEASADGDEAALEGGDETPAIGGGEAAAAFPPEIVAPPSTSDDDDPDDDDDGREVDAA